MAHIGDIQGAFGTIRHGDVAPRDGWWARLKTLFAILGPGLASAGSADQDAIALSDEKAALVSSRTSGSLTGEVGKSNSASVLAKGNLAMPIW